MYQLTSRDQGQCFMCPEGSQTSVVELTKSGKTMPLCRVHLWIALKNGEAPKKKVKKKREPVTVDTPES